MTDMVIADDIMAKVKQREEYLNNRQRCLDARICPNCGSALKNRNEYLECCVPSCDFNNG